MRAQPWLKEEDQLLRQAVGTYGEQDDWKLVAEQVPGRTNKACRKRWLHSLSPTIKKSAWTPEEDKLLLDLYATHGTKWAQIARHIQGRTDDACSKRYREALDPALRHDEWTPEEDARLVEIHASQGGRWKEVGMELGRGSLSCRNRFRSLERRQNHATHTQAEAEPSEWPYYPPESYHSLRSAVHTHSFREPTPEPLPRKSPNMAPFQFSSSSLSAALSDPPRIHRPLPPEYPYDDWSSPDVASSLSTLPNDSFEDFNFSNGSSPQIDSSDSLLPLDTVFDYVPAFSFHESSTLQKSIDIHTFSYNSLQPFPSPINPYDDFSSTSSSPFVRVASLSPAASPSAMLPADLPLVDQFSDSLLFSQEPSEPPTLPQAQPKPKLKSKASSARLSSLKPVTADHSLKAYACGHCWDRNTKKAFITSKQLFDHTRDAHSGEEIPKPFRCGLLGCDKSWKSVNGLQYHLQVSTDHFTHALRDRLSAHRQRSGADSEAAGSVSDPEHRHTRKLYDCPHPNCIKSYRNPSGLRYHLQHGHSNEQRMQLKEVPAILERQLSVKTKMMERNNISGTPMELS